MQLRVDGRTLNCPRKVFDLLSLVCARPGNLISRSDVFEALWPHGQVVSDEALTRLVFRARAVLGRYADRLATIRGQGLRLDAVVTPLLAAETRHPLAGAARDSAKPTLDFDPPTTQSMLAAQAPAAKRHNWRASMVVSMAVVVLALASMWALRQQPAQAKDKGALLDAGYGLYQGDLHVASPETEQMVVDALRNEQLGERPRGMQLLEVAHETDAETPIPALLLALWYDGHGDEDTGDAWLEQAQLRAKPIREPYVRLLTDYVKAELQEDPERIIDTAGAVLDLRPDAWRMRAARSHLMEYIGMREAALKEIQHIEINDLADRKRSLIIADRASFGDVEGAQAILDRLDPSQDPASHAFFSGRVAWSRGDFTSAFNHFERATELAYGVARLDIYRRSLIFAGAIAAMQWQDAQAIDRLERARSSMKDRYLLDEVDLTLFLAQLHAAGGQLEDMRRELQRALLGANQIDSEQLRMAVYYAAWRLAPDVVMEPPAGISPELHALWRGLKAYMHGQPESAASALAEARLNGIEHSRQADEARWLAWRLGQTPASAEPMDPPYPPLSRVMVRREIERGLLPESAAQLSGASSATME